MCADKFKNSTEPQATLVAFNMWLSWRKIYPIKGTLLTWLEFNPTYVPEGLTTEEVCDILWEMRNRG